MKISKVLLIVFVLIGSRVHTAFSQLDELKEGFIDPPGAYSMLPFWSWNGTLERDRLLWQLEQMKEKGIDGAFMHARVGINKGGTPYFSEGWWNAVDVVIDFAAKNNFNAYLYDEDKWPSGSAGGRTLKRNPDAFVKKGLQYNTMEITGPNSIQIDQEGTVIGIYTARLTGEKTIDPSTITDITHLNHDAWQAPVGNWAIISFTQFNDPGQQIDYLDKDAVQEFIVITHEEYYRRYGKYFGNIIPGVFFDEIYASLKQKNSLVWTDDFLEQFQKIKGYALRDKLPLLVFDGGETTNELNNDYFDVFTQLYLNAWFKPYHDWCEQHGIWVTGHTEEGYENYLTQGDYFKTMGQLQVPGSDNEHYRYGFPRFISWRKPKQISSIAHIYGRERVMVEAMGGGGYVIPPEDYRSGFAMLGAYGINMFIPHLFHYDFETPITKTDYPASWFYRNPYWKYFKPLADYSKRISYMGSQGVHVCKVAMLYPLTSKWADGYSPKYDDKVYDELQGLLLKHYYDFDLIDPTSLKASNTSVKGLTIQDETYQLLILPNLDAVDLASTEKITEFVAKGGVVLSVAKIPSFSPEGREEASLVHKEMYDLFQIDPAKIYHRMFNMDRDKKHYYNVREYPSGGKAIFTQFLWEVPTILNRFLGPDLQVESNTDAGLRFNHRKVGDIHYYLVVNESKTNGTFKVTIKGTGIPEHWDPENGEINQIQNYTWKEGKTELILHLDPLAAAYIVLRPSASQPMLQEPITESDVDITEISTVENGIQVKGWGRTNRKHSLTVKIEKEEVTQTWPSSTKIQELRLDGPWEFQLTQHELDYRWVDEVPNTEIELPVMQFQWTKSSMRSPGQLSTDRWKMVKIKELYSDLLPTERHLSSWDASWVNYFDESKKLYQPEVWFRKTLELAEDIQRATIYITADKRYELFVNDQSVGADHEWRTVENYDLKNVLVKGENKIEVHVNDAEGLLAQLDIISNSGKQLTIHTDDSWEASIDRYVFLPALIISAPPLGKWGNIARPGVEMEFPLRLWYSMTLPLGAKTLLKPDIKGDYQLFINGKEIAKSFKKGQMNMLPFLENGISTIQLSILAQDMKDGLLQPLRFLCGNVSLDLASWTDYGIWWYSGRGIYKKRVNISKEYIDEKVKLEIDLGEVSHFAELWVNGKLVKFFPWGPYKGDITEFIHEGENDITIVVANLLANKALWDIPDENLHDEKSRWWHHGGVRREPDKLKSGLLGPVRIIPYTFESVTILPAE